MKRRLIFSLIITFLVFILYSYRLVNSYSFDNDFARDLVDILGITRGHPTLIGPSATIGIQTGPYYYYLLTPAYWFSGKNIDAVLYFNSLLFAIAIGFFFYKSFGHLGAFWAFTASFSLALLPFIVNSSRNPSNALTYLPFLIVTLTLIVFEDINSKKNLAVIGFLTGLITTFHYANFIIFLMLIPFLLFYLKRKSDLIFFLIFFSIAFTPLLLFEVKHNFVMTRNLFINRSYINFVNNNQLGGPVEEKRNLINNIPFILNNIGHLLTFNPLLLLFLGAFASFQKGLKEKIYVYSSIFGIALIILLMRYQFMPYYLFPIVLFLFFSTIYLLVISKYKYLLLLFVIWEIIHFPLYIYNPSTRPYQKFDNAIKEVIDHNLVRSDRKFNVMQIRPDTIIVPHGNEYRYFMLTKELNPLPETDYTDAQDLYIFSEIKDLQLSDIKNWEINQYKNTQNLSVQKYNLQNSNLEMIVFNK